MADRIPSREITPPSVYFNRRNFLRGALVAGGAVGTGLLYRKINGVDIVENNASQLPGLTKSNYVVDGETITPELKITNYNNFYEFTTDKDGVAAAAATFDTSNWKVEIGGLCHKPRTFDLDDIRRIAPPEERVYRFRCVEAWSMVVPWAGYSFSKLLAMVEPTADAKYVALQTLLDPRRMPGQKSSILQWPYVEGYRLDEAMNPLCLLTTGLYGKELPPQDGAPLRIIIPWKYGFKNIKTIVKIMLVKDQPPTSWNRYATAEYGFYGNVNPHHDHPRWSQATEQRLNETGRRDTLMFNGYADEVASLYTGMDLDVDF
jgi:sulfoxide reductase catalytic subunit YedY|nr:protein-methionine-sulfoxide reductase catalytic subunit MsrP [Kofleriaceae bacterium]